MTEFSGSRFVDLLPDNLASQVEVQAISYAVGRQIEKLCAYADKARTYAAVAGMPDKVLDILAVELRTPAYNENYSIEVKRALIEGTMTFYMRMGTPSAVNQIIAAIFGSGYIKEWFDYEGEPYHFKAFTTNQDITLEDTKEFQRILSTVKRKSAWLDEILLEISMEPAAFYAGCTITEYRQEELSI